MIDNPEVCAEACEVAHAAAAPECRAALLDGFHPGKVPELDVTEDRIRVDASDTRKAFERYVANPVYRQLVDTRADEIDGHPADVLWSEDEVAVENEFLHVGSPPLTRTGDWKMATDSAAERLPEMPGDEAVQWRFSYRDGRHPTVWRLVHVPTGWRSPTASRWSRTDEGEYEAYRGAYGYRVVFTPDGSEPARVEPFTAAAYKEMAGLYESHGYDADGNTVDLAAWYCHPMAEPTTDELRQAYLDGELTEAEFDEALGNAVDLEVDEWWESDEDGELAEIEIE